MTEPLVYGRNRYVKSTTTPLTNADCTPSETAQWVVLALDDAELKELTSALDFGAHALYPDRPNEVIWHLEQGLECSMDSFCQFLVDTCLADPDVLQSILNGLAAGGALQNTAGASVPQQEILDRVLVDLGAGCDDEDRFGACYKVVELLDVVFSDLLDVLSLFSTNIEFAQEMAEKIPIIGQYTSTPLQIAGFMAEIAVDSYTLAYDTNVHDDIACAIFCRMGASCQLTMQMIIDGYTDILTIELEPPALPSTWLAIAQFLFDVAEIFSDNVVVGACHWLILQVFARGSAFNASTDRIIAIALSSWVPVALPAGGCECSWYHDWINGNDDGSEYFTFFPVGGSGTPSYNSANDRIEGVYHPTGVPTASNYILMRFDGSGLPFTLSRVKFYLEVSNQRSAADGFYLSDSAAPTYPPGGTAIYSVDLANGQVEVDTGAINSGDGTVVSDGLSLYAFVAQTNDAQTFWINRIEIWGKGDDPFA